MSALVNAEPIVVSAGADTIIESCSIMSQRSTWIIIALLGLVIYLLYRLWRRDSSTTEPQIQPPAPQAPPLAMITPEDILEQLRSEYEHDIIANTGPSQLFVMRKNKSTAAEKTKIQEINSDDDGDDGDEAASENSIEE